MGNAVAAHAASPASSPPASLALRLRDVLVEKPLGRGSFASVFRGRLLQNGRPVALKRLRLEHKKASLTEVQREVAALRMTHSPFVAALLGAFVHEQQVWLVLELCEAGTVADLVRVGGALPDRAIAGVVFGITHGLRYLHAIGIVHRDIKSANVVLTPDGSVKLVDFGVCDWIVEENGGYSSPPFPALPSPSPSLGNNNAKPSSSSLPAIAEAEDPAQAWVPRRRVRRVSAAATEAENPTDPTTNTPPKKAEKRTSLVGTAVYMAPEVVLRRHSGPPADIWALGVVAVECATGKVPRAKQHEFRAMQDIARRGAADLLASLAPAPKAFAAACLQFDPAQRSTAAELARHAFVAKTAPAAHAKAVVAALAAKAAAAAERAARRRSHSRGGSSSSSVGASDSGSSSSDDDDDARIRYGYWDFE